MGCVRTGYYLITNFNVDVKEIPRIWPIANPRRISTGLEHHDLVRSQPRHRESSAPARAGDRERLPEHPRVSGAERSRQLDRDVADLERVEVGGVCVAAGIHEMDERSAALGLAHHRDLDQRM